MRTRRWIVGALLLVGCSTSEGDGITGPPPPLPVESRLVARWYSTSLVADGVDATAQGMGLVLEFRTYYQFKNVLNYSLGVYGDLLGFCDPGPNCFYAGEFSTTRASNSSGPRHGQLTLDPGTVSEATFNYSLDKDIAGSYMTMIGNIDGTPITLDFYHRPNFCFGC